MIVLYFVEMWKILGLWTWKSMECCKKGLIGHSSRFLNDNTADSHADYKSTAQKVTERKKKQLYWRLFACMVFGVLIDKRTKGIKLKT